MEQEDDGLMWSVLESIFEELCLPYFRQGSLAPDEPYPSPSFYTFWNLDEAGAVYYDNRPANKEWTWAVYSYTNDPSCIYSLLDAFVLKAIEKGFIIGERKDAASDLPDYYGRYLLIRYIEELKPYGSENQ